MSAVWPAGCGAGSLHLFHGGGTALPGEPGFLTAGERGYLATMHRIFTNAVLRRSAEPLLVMDDDVVLSCRFPEVFLFVGCAGVFLPQSGALIPLLGMPQAMRRLLADPRCGSLVSHQSLNGGVLLLGASIHVQGEYPHRGAHAGGWRLLDEDLRQVSPVGVQQDMLHTLNPAVPAIRAGHWTGAAAVPGGDALCQHQQQDLWLLRRHLSPGNLPCACPRGRRGCGGSKAA